MTDEGQQGGAGGNGAALPEAPMPTFEDVIASAILAFAPHLSDAQARALCTAELGLEPRLRVVYQDAIVPEKQQQYPAWGYKITRRGEPAWTGIVKAPKRLDTANGAEALVQSVQVIAFLTSPIARAVLRAHGYDIVFIQAPASAPTPKIISA